MTGIRKKVYLYAFLSGICIIMSVTFVLLSIREPYLKKYSDNILSLSLLLTSIPMIVLLKNYKNLKMAEIITENQIIHLQSGYCLIESGTTSSSAKKVDIAISNFGILIGAKIIKFNQRDIWLKAVGMGKDFISLTYGSFGKTQNLQLIHAEFDREELDKVVEKFRFETGIIPQIVK